MRTLFHGGVHPPERKTRTRDLAIADAPPSKDIILPFSQSVGKPATPIVQKGERVLRGQRVADHSGYVSAAVHASVSGTVKTIVAARHPMGFLVDALHIENDFADEWHPDANLPRDTDGLVPADIRHIVQEAGIVGMGGASFPSHVKLTPPEGKVVDTLILNGAECEPYLTCDDRLMRETPDTIARGLELFMRAVGAKRGIVAIENNKPEAAAAMEAAVARLPRGDVEVRRLPTRYPQGAEKQLIRAVTGREVPSGGLPADAGVAVHNVGSAHAGYEACALSRPLTERVMTFSGEGMARPANLRVRVGQPVAPLLEHCGFDAAATKKLLVGGPMMGLPQKDADFVVVKGTTGVTALLDAWDRPYGPCIRCARCVEGCPANLLPCELSNLGQVERLEEMADYNVLDCIECGVCTYVCPSRRPIVQWIRIGKGAVQRAAAAAK